MSEQHGEPGGIPPSSERDDNTLKLMRYFFRIMTAEEHDSPEAACMILPEYFLAWVGQRMSLVDRATALEEAGATEIGWDFLAELTHSPAGPLQVLPVWPMITLADRPIPKHPLKRYQMIMILTWEDGCVFPLSIQIPAELMEGAVMTDAFVASQIIRHYKVFLQHVTESGLDGLHDRFGDDHGGDYPFEVLMGAMIKVMPQLKAELHTYLQKYMRLAQGLIRPPLPPQERARLDQKKRETERQQRHRAEDKGRVDRPPGATGGWDG